MFKLYNTIHGVIITKIIGSSVIFIPVDELNTEYQEYLEYISVNGTPDVEDFPDSFESTTI